VPGDVVGNLRAVRTGTTTTTIAYRTILRVT
jgi:hypothetical protein